MPCIRNARDAGLSRIANVSQTVAHNSVVEKPQYRNPFGKTDTRVVDQPQSDHDRTFQNALEMANDVGRFKRVAETLDVLVGKHLDARYPMRKQSRASNEGFEREVCDTYPGLFNTPARFDGMLAYVRYLLAKRARGYGKLLMQRRELSEEDIRMAAKSSVRPTFIPQNVANKTNYSADVGRSLARPTPIARPSLQRAKTSVGLPLRPHNVAGKNNHSTSVGYCLKQATPIVRPDTPEDDPLQPRPPAAADAALHHFLSSSPGPPMLHLLPRMRRLGFTNAATIRSVALWRSGRRGHFLNKLVASGGANLTEMEMLRALWERVRDGRIVLRD
ncbi:hypothetical protein PLICRDRAFT_51045 [Plicaturopsis crispa FD-325 SS-3]|nr:hypothetical protein PLICRDRAFT_51045 [Plicaturopsis crispa FD-325 SS-3]